MKPIRHKTVIADTVGRVQITREADGRFRCVTRDGVGLCTVMTLEQARREARAHLSTKALVKLVGKETAIEMMRAGHKPGWDVCGRLKPTGNSGNVKG